LFGLLELTIAALLTLGHRSSPERTRPPGISRWPSGVVTGNVPLPLIQRRSSLRQIPQAMSRDRSGGRFAQSGGRFAQSGGRFAQTFATAVPAPPAVLQPDMTGEWRNSQPHALRALGNHSSRG
jgi:hypothetical protein